MPLLETARLRLRPLSRDDLPAVVELAGDPQVAEQTARIPHPLGMAEAEAWWAACTEVGRGRREHVMAIERRSDGAFLGAIGVILAGDDAPAELGFWLGRRYWNQGYMTEAARRFLAHVFDDLRVPLVRGRTLVGNRASACVQEKLGMRLVGRAVQTRPDRCCGREAEVREVTPADLDR